MAEWDLNELIADIRARGSIPDDDANFTTDEIRKAATLEMREGVAPVLVRCRTEHLVYRHEQTITAGTAAYRMPTRAMAGSLRDVIVVGSNGSARPPLVAISSDDPRAQAGTSGEPFAYYIRNHHVVLVYAPTASGTLRLPYYARPNKLVLPSTCGVVTSASYTAATGDNEVFVSDPPETLQTDGMAIDLVRGTPGFETLFSGDTNLVEEVSPDVWHYMFVTSEDPGIARGDYVCLPGESPVPQVPVECHGLLAARTAMRLLKSAGDDRWQALREDVKELEANAITLISSRVASGVEQPGGLLCDNPLIT